MYDSFFDRFEYWLLWPLEWFTPVHYRRLQLRNTIRADISVVMQNMELEGCARLKDLFSPWGELTRVAADSSIIRAEFDDGTAIRFYPMPEDLL